MKLRLGTLPQTKVFHDLNHHVGLSMVMTKKRSSRQQLEEPQFDFKVTETIHEETDNNDLENEIECPSCQSVMMLNSAYDSRYSGCNDCNYCFYM